MFVLQAGGAGSTFDYYRREGHGLKKDDSMPILEQAKYACHKRITKGVRNKSLREKKNMRICL
jgi:hypothetical protein